MILTLVFQTRGKQLSALLLKRPKVNDEKKSMVTSAAEESCVDEESTTATTYSNRGYNAQRRRVSILISVVSGCSQFVHEERLFLGVKMTVVSAETEQRLFAAAMTKNGIIGTNP